METTETQLYRFFLNWELKYRQGECRPDEEREEMSPQDIARNNAACLINFIEAGF